MNQILEFETENRGKKNKGHKHVGGGSTSDKIVKVFAVLLMIFAVALIGSGVYSLTQNNTEEETTTNISEVQTVNANIETTLDEENSQVIVTIESEIAISKVVYNWNSNSQMTIDGDSQTTLELSVDLPVGSNTLNIKVTDIEGNETKQSFDFDSESGDDIINPNITLEASGSTLIITATDETELSFITYRWNDDEETTVEPEDDDLTTVVVELEIPKGTNTITVVAVDASSKHNTRTETKTITGKTIPEITYSWKDEKTLTITCTHESGISEVHYTLNDQEAQATFDDSPTTVEFDVEMEEGYNLISVSATSVEDTTATFDGECTIGDSSETDTDDTDNTDTEADN